MPDGWVRVKYSEDEEGWVKSLDGVRGMVANIPWSPDLNFGDVVRYEDGEVIEVVAREYPFKAFLDYDDEASYFRFARALKELDIGEAESVVDGSGMAALRVGEDDALEYRGNQYVDVKALAASMGVSLDVMALCFVGG